MTYRVLLQGFAGKEFRAVCVPLSGGCRRPKSCETQETTGETIDSEGGVQGSTAPPSMGGGGGSDSGVPGPLDDGLEIVKPRQGKESNFKSYGRTARERVRRCGVAAEYIDADPGSWAFYTLTFPTGSPDGMRAIADNSGRIVQDVKNLLRGIYGTLEDYFYVWERQRRGTLHLHLCYRSGSMGCGGKIENAVRDGSVRIVSKHSRQTGVNLWAGRGDRDWSTRPEALQVNLQKVRKGVGRYLAKYCAKSASEKVDYWRQIGSPSPRRWWGCSKSIKSTIELLTTTERRDYNNYMSASNAFDDVVAKLRLHRVNGVEYSGDISSVTGRYYSMFTENPCVHLNISRLLSGKPLKWSGGGIEMVNGKEKYSLLKDAAPTYLELLTLRKSKQCREVLEQSFRDLLTFMENTRCCPSASMRLTSRTLALVSELEVAVSNARYRLTVPKQRQYEKDLLATLQTLRAWLKSYPTQAGILAQEISSLTKVEYEQLTLEM